MIARIWSGESPLWLLLLPLSWLYGLVSWLIRLSYQRGWRTRWRAPGAGGGGRQPDGGRQR